MIRKEEPQAAAEWVAVDALSAWKDNPRDNEAAIDRVAASIKRFGFGAPIVARRQGLEVIAGHTRLAAAIRLGLEQVPVRLLDLSETEAHALALADNKLSELAEWDDAKLNAVLRELSAADVDVASLGWSETEMSAMLDDICVDDVKWKEFDEGVGDDAPAGKQTKCPHCGETFDA